ncbi:hypothetical protein ACMFMF_009335 [Clarireedia jacksonii]
MVIFSLLPSFTLPPIASGVSIPHFLRSKVSPKAASIWLTARVSCSSEANAWICVSAYEWFVMYEDENLRRYAVDNHLEPLRPSERSLLGAIPVSSYLADCAVPKDGVGCREANRLSVHFHPIS